MAAKQSCCAVGRPSSYARRALTLSSSSLIGCIVPPLLIAVTLSGNGVKRISRSGRDYRHARPARTADAVRASRAARSARRHEGNRTDRSSAGTASPSVRLDLRLLCRDHDTVRRVRARAASCSTAWIRRTGTGTNLAGMTRTMPTQSRFPVPFTTRETVGAIAGVQALALVQRHAPGRGRQEGRGNAECIIMVLLTPLIARQL
jgi:hypothetical protein